MALIKCPECGKEISDKSKMCVNCGCPIKIKRKHPQNKKILKIMLIVGCAFLSFGIVSLFAFECITFGDFYEPYYYFIDSELHIVSFSLIYIGVILCLLSSLFSKKYKSIMIVASVTVICICGLAFIGKYNCEKIIYNEINDHINSEDKYRVYEKGSGYDWDYHGYEFLDNNTVKVVYFNYDFNDLKFNGSTQRFYQLYKTEVLYHYEIKAPLFGLYGIYDDGEFIMYRIDSDGNVDQTGNSDDTFYIWNAKWCDTIVKNR